MYHRTSSRRRAGFTLVEALVVVAILAILFAMTTAAVMRALITAEDARVSIEIKQFEASISAFKSEFGMPYVPSKIRLRNNLANYFLPTADNLDVLSRNYLFSMFPRLDKTKIVGWNGNRTDAAFTIVLDGPECLVFFIGGKQGIQGWSKNQTDPWNGPVTGPDNRVKSFFEFNPDRLKPRVSALFPVYHDPYNTGQPYLYFSAQKSGNDYSPMKPPNDKSAFENYNASAPNGQGQDNVRAFYDPKTSRFHNPNSFQIISAGRDGLFGEFSLPNPSTAGFNPNDFIQWNNGNYLVGWSTTTPARRNAPMDNLANFHPTKLGIPQ